VRPQSSVAIKGAQALATCLFLASLMLEAAVGRGIMLVLSPDSQAVFEQTAAGSGTAAAISIILGYGLPIAAFGVLYLIVALRITRGRRWTWVLALLLGVAGVVLCFTTVAKLLTFVGWALLVFQAGLVVFLLASWPYFWSASPPGSTEGADAGAASVPVSDSEAS
jgi:hypothetical protein